MKDCKPLELRGADNETFAFTGIDSAVKGIVDAASLLTSPHMIGGEYLALASLPKPQNIPVCLRIITANDLCIQLQHKCRSKSRFQDNTCEEGKSVAILGIL